ncbi:choice-of-anchor G family protein [Raineyella sp.]|uniref:Choice-of-anchor G family protein n=1 Tax=bioreactor metagenome TaxID=1076179 RepID=A0A644Z8S6_9ZZZZ|nr:choice-of-anchor G family protein [Raineyella sp.]MEA5153985.1 choice-of-anchor G family protein [Raineyella sp.]
MSDPTSSPAPSGAANASNDPFRKPSRRSIVVGAAWAVPAVVAVQGTPAWATSPTTCPTLNYTQLRGASQFLSGVLLGFPLSSIFPDQGGPGTLVDLKGLEATWTSASGTTVANPATASPAGPPGAYIMPVDLSLLHAIEVALSLPAQSLITTGAGAINEWAQAAAGGIANGSTGAIDNSSGAINFAQASQPTTWASINLKNLLNNALNGGLNGLGGAVAGNVTDLSLDLGAIAGRAWWSTTPPDCNCVKRDYLLAWAKLVLDSPLLTALYNLLVPIINGLQGTLNTAIGQSGIINGLLTQITNAINAINIAGLVGLTSSANLSVTLNASTALSALGNDLFPSSDLIDVGLGAGKKITVDLGVLLGGAYQPDGTNSALNGLAPNTSLLVNGSAVTNLVAQLGQIGTNVVEILQHAIKVNLHLDVYLTLTVVKTKVITIDLYSGNSGTNPASLYDLLHNNFYLKAEALSGLPIVGQLLTAVTALITSTLNGLVGQIGTAINTLVVQQVLTTAVKTAISNLTGFVSDLLTKLFITPGVLSLTANAQNDPTVACTPPGTYGPEPTDWTGITDGEYDVAALRLSVLGAVSTKLVTLYLARAAVGPITHTP